MAQENRHITGNIDAHLSGGRWFVVAVSTVWAAAMLSGIYTEMRNKNELERQKLEVQMRQTEIMQRQHVLDSLRFVAGR